MVTTTDGQKQFPALTLCSIAVKCFIDDLRKTYSTDSSILDVLQDVMKILIVPDRWQNFKTEFMLTVSKEAGIDDQELMIVTESEAAFANVQQDFITNDPGSWGSCQKSSFIVLNCGGNTLDITINQIEEATSIKQILNKQVNNCGWILVKEGFIKFMIDVFGSAIHAKWCCEYSDESVDFYRSVECKIFRFNQKPDVITIKLPISFCQILENETGLDANSLIAQAHFAGELSIVSDKLRIKSSLFKTIFNDALKSITMQLQSVLAVFNICKIILVGSFCENRVVVETLRESYPDIDIYVSNKASVMRGATLSRQYI